MTMTMTVLPNQSRELVLANVGERYTQPHLWVGLGQGEAMGRILLREGSYRRPPSHLINSIPSRSDCLSDLFPASLKVLKPREHLPSIDLDECVRATVCTHLGRIVTGINGLQLITTLEVGRDEETEARGLPTSLPTSQ